MLTRIEIDGFKTFDRFHLDVPPFLVVLGPNASGKSNLFDAIQLLGRLADHDLALAVKELRGEPLELFRRDPSGRPGQSMKLAVEVLLDPRIRDSWGSEQTLTHTRLRYEVVISRREDAQGLDRLYVTEESARPILAKDDPWRAGGSIGLEVRKQFLRYARQSPFLSHEETDEGQGFFSLAQDGRQGRKRKLPAHEASASALSSVTTAEFLHLFALREEFRHWRLLQLDPAALRKASPRVGPDHLLPDGSNLATVLARIQASSRNDRRSRGVLADIAADLGALVPGVTDVRVEPDKEERENRIEIEFARQPPFSSRVVSDGTLRLLALLTMLHDPQFRGLVCFEEPENGVHPGRLERFLEKLGALTTDLASEDVDPERPLAQILVNSHSPVVLSSRIESGSVVFCDLVSSVGDADGACTVRTRMRPVNPENQRHFRFSEDMGVVSGFEVREVLNTVESGE